MMRRKRTIQRLEGSCSSEMCVETCASGVLILFVDYHICLYTSSPVEEH